MSIALVSRLLLLSGTEPRAGMPIVRTLARGPVRSEIELGTAWLGSVAGCVLHDDCLANPELGLECAASSSRA